MKPVFGVVSFFFASLIYVESVPVLPETSEETPPVIKNLPSVFSYPKTTFSVSPFPTRVVPAAALAPRTPFNKNKKPVVLSEKSVEVVSSNTESGGFRPLNVKWTKNPGRQVQNYSVEELRVFLYSLNFQKLDNKTLYDLRRIWIAYKYDQFFWDVHTLSGFPVSIIYAYFIIEATRDGIESSLMANHMNPGGVKFIKGRSSGFVKAKDDCGAVPCKFASYANYNEMVSGWSGVFSQNRYIACKSYSTAVDICKCLQSSGYHTANSWNMRSKISKEYWDIRKHFPKK